jgi:hypothetical protein
MRRSVREFYQHNKVLASLLGSFCTFLFFWSATFVLRNFNPSGEIDSQINTILLLTLFTTGVIYLLLIGLKIKIEIVYAIILGLLVAYLSTSLMLINVDRSRSFYVLSWINEYDLHAVADERTYQMVRSSEILAVIPINQRITEQVRRGFVTSQQGKLVLTFKGRSALGMAELLANGFQLKGWYKNKY